MTEKVSFYLEEKPWERFKEIVFRATGSVRSLSKEMNKLIINNTLLELEDELKALIFPEEMETISIEEIKRNRPRISQKAEVVIRNMRDANVDLS